MMHTDCWFFSLVGVVTGIFVARLLIWWENGGLHRLHSWAKCAKVESTLPLPPTITVAEFHAMLHRLRQHAFRDGQTGAPGSRKGDKRRSGKGVT